MSHESHELELHIDHTQHLYRMKQAIFVNLAKKKAKGQYDPALAVKGLMHLTTAGAKDYNKSFSGRDWNKVFSMADRKEAAVNYENEFRTDFYVNEWPHTAEGKKFIPGLSARMAKAQKARVAKVFGAPKPARKSARKPTKKRPLTWKNMMPSGPDPKWDARVKKSTKSRKAAHCSICRGPHKPKHGKA